VPDVVSFAVAVALAVITLAPMAHAQGARDVLATGVPRPLQLAMDGRVLLVLSPGAGGESAGEIYRVPLDGAGPLDLTGQPRIRIPFAGGGGTTLGSLAVDPATDALYLGEENGKRLWRLGADGRLVLYATGLRRLQGGSTVTFDHQGRLLVVDYADPYISPSEDRTTPGLEQLRDEDYKGPLLFRLDLDPTFPLPRRVVNLAPLWPRAWAGRAGGSFLPHLISVAPLPRHDIVLLASTGELHRLSSEGVVTLLARLPRGQYHRTSMVAAPDGTVYVSGGFHTGQVFRVAPDGAVTAIASDLSDPAGIALDSRGALYVAESGLHRILRIRAP